MRHGLLTRIGFRTFAALSSAVVALCLLLIALGMSLGRVDLAVEGFGTLAAILLFWYAVDTMRNS